MYTFILIVTCITTALLCICWQCWIYISSITFFFSCITFFYICEPQISECTLVFFFLSRDIFAKTITPVMETETIGLESPFELRRLYVIT